MALSTTHDFNLTAEKVVRLAFRKLRLPAGDTPVILRAYRDLALEELNVILKEMAIDYPIHQWKIDHLRVKLIKHRNRYEFGSLADQVYRIKFKSHAIAAAVSGASTVDVAGATTDYATTDNSVEIHLNDGTVHVTTITNVASISGGVRLTLSAVLDGGMDLGAQVETYVLDTRVPLRIVDAQRVENPATLNPSSAPLQIFSRKDLYELGGRTNDGTVYGVFYERVLAGSGSPAGYLHVAAESDTTLRELRITAQIPILDVDSASDHIDIKPEHLNTLVYVLADQLADSVEGVDPDHRADLANKAARKRSQSADYDDETDATVDFGPRMDYYR